MKSYTSKNRVIRKKNRSLYKPFFKKQKAVNANIRTRFTNHSIDGFSSLNNSLLQNFNSMNSANKIEQQKVRNDKKFYKFITAHSLNNSSQHKAQTKSPKFIKGLPGLRYNLKIPANIEFRLDVLLFRSAFMNPKNSFYVNKLLRSGKIMVNSKVETNGSRTLVPGDQFEVAVKSSYDLDSNPEYLTSSINSDGFLVTQITKKPKMNIQAKPNVNFQGSQTSNYFVLLVLL